jgi:hypothetical protein
MIEILLRRRVNRVRLRLGTAERASFSQTIPPGSIPSRKHISHVVFTEAKNMLLDFFGGSGASSLLVKQLPPTKLLLTF